MHIPARFFPVIVLLAATIGCSDDEPTADEIPRAPQIMPTPLRELWFGPTMVRGDAQHAIVVMNSGRGELVLSGVELQAYGGPDPSSAFTLGAWPTEPLGYQRTLSVPVTFSPVGPGVHTARVVITSNAENLPVAEIDLIGPALDPVAAQTVSFFPGATVVRTTNDARRVLVRFMNLGDDQLIVTAYEIAGLNAGSFSIAAESYVPSPPCSAGACGEPLPPGCSPVRLGSGAFVELALAYAPTVAGVNTATFRVISNSATCPDEITLRVEQ